MRGPTCIVWANLTPFAPKFLQLAAAPDAFIARAVALAIEGDLAGWNIGEP
jgi:hypothetical protein